MLYRQHYIYHIKGKRRSRAQWSITILDSDYMNKTLHQLYWTLDIWSDERLSCFLSYRPISLGATSCRDVILQHRDSRHDDHSCLEFTIQSIILKTGYVFQEAETGIYAKLWAKASETPDLSLTPTWTYGLDVMFSDEGPPVPTVYTSDLSVLLFEAKESGKCNWGVIPEFYFPSGYGLGLPQPTPFKTHVDNA